MFQGQVPPRSSGTALGEIFSFCQHKMGRYPSYRVVRAASDTTSEAHNTMLYTENVLDSNGKYIVVNLFM